jgi:hypothetical protein
VDHGLLLVLHALRLAGLALYLAFASGVGVKICTCKGRYLKKIYRIMLTNKKQGTWIKGTVKLKKRGGCKWYQSIGLYFLYISANFVLFFKGPRPFK